ncbi:hypothetical protein DPEC_G00312430 [Dallia pectoralis]|uniref:Uncharacterized protein n=1 Tax=Dallia pectoralis TaxID=75939 RepID=A0ACC2FBK3_DALPE|nr:hypothetical protein DPEC_G00312430 [Dallia pectoralis]
MCIAIGHLVLSSPPTERNYKHDWLWQLSVQRLNKKPEFATWRRRPRPSSSSIIQINGYALAPSRHAHAHRKM